MLTEGSNKVPAKSVLVVEDSKESSERIVKSLENIKDFNFVVDETSSTLEGVELSFRLFIDVLEKAGIRPIDPTGEPFDPEYHEAMRVLENPDAEPGSVLEVIQKGYTLNDRLVRPARVLVAKDMAEPKTAP